MLCAAIAHVAPERPRRSSSEADSTSPTRRPIIGHKTCLSFCPSRAAPLPVGPKGRQRLIEAEEGEANQNAAPTRSSPLLHREGVGARGLVPVRREGVPRHPVGARRQCCAQSNFEHLVVIGIER